MPLQLYEAVRWGNASEDPLTGGANGWDTCLLVRAGSVEAAARLADRELAALPAGDLEPWTHVVYLLGEDAGTDTDARVLRGPYVQPAYRHGWRQWAREGRDGAWVEQPAG